MKNISHEQNGVLGDTQKIARLFCRSPLTCRIQIDDPTFILDRMPSLITIAENHGLDLFLFEVLQNAGLLSRIPIPLYEHLQNKVKKEAQAHQRRIEELKMLHEEFCRIGIPYILLKEYAFDGTFTQDGGIKQNDLDILILSGDMQAMTHSLEQSGYVRKSRSWKDEYRYEQPGHTSIDLQISCSPHLGYWADPIHETASLFERAQKMRIQNMEIPILHPVDRAVFLLKHTALFHNFTPFSKIAACWNVLVLNQVPVPYHSLNESLKSEGWNRMGWFSLHYMEQLCGYDFSYYQIKPTPPEWEHRFFHYLMGAEKYYFEASTFSKLCKRTRKGFHLFLYPDKISRRMACLFTITWKNVTGFQ